jgi:hypothetical protein
MYVEYCTAYQEIHTYTENIRDIGGGLHNKKYTIEQKVVCEVFWGKK